MHIHWASISTILSNAPLPLLQRESVCVGRGGGGETGLCQYRGDEETQRKSQWEEEKLPVYAAVPSLPFPYPRFPFHPQLH